MQKPESSQLAEKLVLRTFVGLIAASLLWGCTNPPANIPTNPTPTSLANPERPDTSNLTFSDYLIYPKFPEMEESIIKSVENSRALPAHLLASTGLAFNTDGNTYGIGSAGIVQNENGEYYIYTAYHLIRSVKDAGAQTISINLPYIGTIVIPIEAFINITNTQTGENRNPDGVSYIKLTSAQAQKAIDSNVLIPYLLPDNSVQWADTVNYAAHETGTISYGIPSNKFDDGSFNVTSSDKGSVSCSSMSGAGIIGIGIDPNTGKKKGYLIGIVIAGLEQEYPVQRENMSHCSSVTVGVEFPDNLK